MPSFARCPRRGSGASAVCSAEAAKRSSPGIAIGANGAVYAAGYTRSSDFPTRDAVQPSLRGASDAFLVRLSPALAIDFATYFGGDGADSGWGVTVDRTGNPILTGILDGKPAGRKEAFAATLVNGQMRKLALGGPHDLEAGYDGSNVRVARDGSVWLAAMRDIGKGASANGLLYQLDGALTRTCAVLHEGLPGRDLLEGVSISPSGRVAAAGVAFVEAPSPLHIRLAENLYAGSYLVLTAGKPCSRR